MSTFCRITGRSRGLPKPNYFPLLPPISPADAKRFCRITGKAYGLPTHHFIPVLVGRPKRKSKAAQNVSTQRIEGQCLSHGKRHIILKDFRYVSPSFKNCSELDVLLTSKNVECNDKYVYTVDESRCNLVFPAKLEACVRDGDVREIMLAKDLESVLLKLRRGLNVSLDVDDIDVSGMVLWEGDGPNEDVIRNRMKRKRVGSTDLVRKIFEDKEHAAEALLEESERKRPKVRNDRIPATKREKIEKQAWNNFKEETVSSIVDSNVEKILKVVLAGKDWDQLDKDTDKSELLISTLPTPVNIESENVDLGISLPGIIQQPLITANFTGFEPAVAVTPITPFLNAPDRELLDTIKSISHEDLFKTANVDKVFTSTTKSLELLPTVTEISEIIANLKNGQKAVQEQILTRNFVNEVHGLKVEIEAGERFVVGLTVDSLDGPVFIPGQTVNMPIGDTFVPGITVQTQDKRACILPGLPIKIKDENNVETEVFVAGQNLMTRDGEKFVPGQTIMTNYGTKFVPGQTVFTGDAPRFVPGQIMPGEKMINSRFIPGQTETTQREAKFVPGQTVLLSNGDIQFIPGQSVENKDGWDFVPGKSVCRAEGGMKFLPGREIKTGDSFAFVPGQFVIGDSGEDQFIPGTSLISDYRDLQFILDSNISSPRGEQFVKRISIAPENVNLNASVPGIIQQPKLIENIVGFETIFHAAHINPLMDEPDSNILKSVETLHHEELFKTAEIEKVFNVSTTSFELLPKIREIPEIMANLKNGQKAVQEHIITRNFVDEVHGLRVEIGAGPRFIIGHHIETPTGQVFIPGQTIKIKKQDSFVPGITVQTTDNRACLLPGLPIKTKTENGINMDFFVAGQNVMTRDGEKFVKGQTLLTSEGIKFVPGQTVIIDGAPYFIPGQVLLKGGIVECRFIPGLTETSNYGTKFIPGQVMTMSGGESEFVPGQSIHGENGWVFVPGKSVETIEGGLRFLPGKEVRTEDGSNFQPGHYVMADDGSVQFVLGLSVIKSYGDMQFVPTEAMNSPEKMKNIIPDDINLGHALPGVIEQPAIKGSFVSLEPTFVSNPITPLMIEPDKHIPEAIKELSHEILFKTVDVDKVFNKSTKSFELLPTIGEIPEIMAHLKSGKKGVQEEVLTRNFVNEVHGLEVETRVGVRFVVGQSIDLPNGTAFIPGQTVKTSKGDTFIPGLTIKTSDGQAGLLPGLPVKKKNDRGVEIDFFVAGQIVVTRDGEKFVQGQNVPTREGFKFVPGQTVIIGDTPHFVAGQILPKVRVEDSRFLPGITESTSQGAKFVPGQLMNLSNGEIEFIPGQNVDSASGWVFVPGKSVSTEEGGSKFVPGKETKTKDGVTHQLGYYSVGDDGNIQFQPGMPDVKSFGDMKFVSTVTMNKIIEEQFVEGISIVSEKVNLSQSSPGLVEQPLITELFVGFEPILASKPITPFLAEPDNNILDIIKTFPHEELFKTAYIEKVFNSSTESFKLLPKIREIPEIVSNLKNGRKAVQEHIITRNFVDEVHGMQVDTGSGQKFVVGQTVQTQNGPIFIPGQTVKTSTGDTFVPGITVQTPENEACLLPGLPIKMKTERNAEVEVFVAGQFVITRDGEKFVQGQTLKTEEGVKFVPGQTVMVGGDPHFVAGQAILGDTLEDSRFIPGQTETSQHGTKFVPGQTLVSSEGNIEFIPGQSVCGANGWVFVPGKSICTIGGGTKFLPGKDIKTEEGVSFVSGQYITGDDGQVDFIPGTFVMKDHEDMKFLPGASMSTPEGEKFVEGQIVKNENGDFKFLPGKSTLSESGKIEFSPAHKIEEVVFHNKISLGIFSNEYSIYAEMKTNGLYGHMVQTEQGVEFFPGSATGLPAGKVIPGKLIRGEKEGVKFVPGVMIEDDFIPGQLVLTDKGEQFIPGQVVETEQGPKFVPGQIINSSSGPKFVPGQTVETEDGPKFVPGQIVDTRAGPTFIPGQIIFTEEAGSRFVPGQVVDTVEGPHFVPGRVLETGNHVTFIPGQVVETSEGLKFVAPDLEDYGGGDCEFSVQSFQVTPEELNLLRLQTGSITPFTGETAVDSKMLRQLSQAGMEIGRQVPAEVPVVDVRTIPAMSTACDLSQRLGLDPLSTIKLSQILTTIIQFNCDPVLLESLTCTGEQMELLEKLIQAVVESDGESEMFESLTILLEETLKNVPNKIEVLDKLHDFIIVSDELQDLRKPSVLHIMKEIIKQHPKATEKLNQVLSTGGEMISIAFRKISENRPELIKAVVRTIAESTTRVDSEKEAHDILHSAIIKVVKESSETSVFKIMEDKKGVDFKSMVVQAVGFARALGLNEVAADLLQVLSDPKSSEILAGDKLALDILRRLTVMKQLAGNRPTFNNALHKLESDPELARTDVLLRELVRESAALMVVPEEAPVLESSADIPLDIFLQANGLAMEDYLVRSRQRGILLIIKDGIQAVVPREASRAVLTGQVPYSVLDEKGIHHFDPLHVFTALRLPKPVKHIFSMYACKIDTDENEFEGDAPAKTTVNNNFNKLENHHQSIPEQPRLVKKEYGGEIISSKDLFVAKHDFVPDEEDGIQLRKGDRVRVIKTERSDSKKPKLDPDLDIGQDGAALLDNAAAKHKMSIRPRRKHADSRHKQSFSDLRWLVQIVDDPSRQGWVPANSLTLLEDPPENPKEAKYRREAVISELVETEEEFGRDIQQVVDHYLKPLDSKSVPLIVRENKELIFGNLKQIAELHNSVLIEGIKYYANEPRMLGKTFIRLERDFDKHVAYCRDEPTAQEFLQENNVVRDFFEEVSQRLGDDKSLSEHLKLPIQRINDYQLLLKELVKYSSILGDDTTDLGKALELMLAVPHRANDNKFISNIEGYHGNIHKLGRLLRHDWFAVTDREGKSKDRYLFLFKARILICKVRRISEDRFVFVLKDIIRLPEVEVKDHVDDCKVFELHHKVPNFGAYPLTISAHKENIKSAWLTEIREHASDVLALAEHAADDLRLEANTVDHKNIEPLKGIALEPATPDQVLPPVEFNSNKKTAAEEIQKAVNDRRHVIEESIETESVLCGKRKEGEESAELLPSEKKIKTDNHEDMDRFSGSRRSMSSRRVEEFRSVSSTSSQEIHVETASARHQMTSSSSSSRSMKMIEESASINGQTVSQFREVSGDIDGFSSIQEVAAGTTRGGESYAAIEEVRSGTARGSRDVASSRSSVDYSSDTQKAVTDRNGSIDYRRSSSTSSVKLFAKPIGGNSPAVGGKAVFECEVDESCRVTWLKDNKPLPEGQSHRFTVVSTENCHRLEIADVIESDAGMYTARAKNSKGLTSSCTAQLAIDKKVGEDSKQDGGDGHAPFFIVHLKDTQLLENTYLRFMIKVKGKPNPDVKFYKDGRIITSANARIAIVRDNAETGFYELVIADVQQEDAGTYKCIASNTHGEVESECTVSVTDEKKLFVGLDDDDKLLAPGESPHFTWLRDGQPFDPEERFKVLFKDEEDSLALVFQHVKPEDAGLYTCVASTSTGKISCSAELTVQGSVNQLMKEPLKPKIITEIKTQEASIGGSAMLELKIEGYPKPEIMWTKGKEEIKADTRHKFLYEDESSMSLVIKNVQQEDEGDYQVKAVNDLGTDSEVIHLTVKAPPKFKRKLSDSDKMVGEEIKMTVQVEGSPKPSVQWYKDGLCIKSSDRVKLFEEASAEYTLLIKEATLEDAGSYSVVATNELNQCSDFCKVEIRSPPKFIKKMDKTVETNEKDTITYTVKVEGDPKPTIKWLHNGSELTSDGKHVKISEDGQTYTLVVSGVSRADAGEYACQASNKYATVSDSSALHVRCSPQFRTKLADCQANEGDTNVQFTVNVDAFPRPNVQWFHDEVEITEKVTEFTRVEEGDNYKLIIKEVTKELSGKYTCKVVNDLGENSTSSTFTVNSKPKFRKGLKNVQVDEGDSLTLEVEIEGVPEPNVKWYKNGEEVTGDAHIKITRDSKRIENYSMTFTLVRPEDGGEYEVRASNEMGTTVSQSTITVQTKTSHVEEEKQEEEEETPKWTKEDKTEVEEQEEAKKKKSSEDGLEKPKKAEIEEGLQPSKKTLVEDSEDEDRDVFMTDIDKFKPAGSFSCVEVKLDDIIIKDMPDGSSGVVEEYSDNEDNKAKLSVSRGVSIVSVSEEESKNTLTPDEPSTPKSSFLFESGDKESENSEKRPKSNDLSDENKARKASVADKIGSSEMNEADDNSKKQSKTNDSSADEDKARKASIRQLETTELKEADDSSKKQPESNELSDKDRARKESIQQLETAESKEADDSSKKQPKLDDSSNKENVRRGSQATLGDQKQIDSSAKLGTAVANGDVKRKQSMKGKKAMLMDQDDFYDEDEEVMNVINHDDADLPEKSLISDVITECEADDAGLKKNVTDDLDHKKDAAVSELNKENIDNNVQEGPQGLDSSRKLSRQGTKEHEGQNEVIAQKQVIDEAPAKKRGLSFDKESGRVEEDGSQDALKANRSLVNGEDIPSRGRKSIVDDNVDEDGLDPQVADLLKRVKKQRSVLEEILDKEGEKSSEAFPQIISHVMENKEVFESLPTHFEVSVTGNPRPDLKWFKDEKPIEPSDADHITLVEEDRYKLEIKKVKLDDEGTYKCVASNKLGEKDQKAVLTVRPESELRGPRCLVPLKNLKVPKGQTAELTAVFTADPEPEIKWTRDGKEVDEVKFILNKNVKEVSDGLVECTYSLKIPAGRHEDTGTYKIEAKNKYGYDESSARLDIILRPEIISFKDTTVTPQDETELLAVIIANPKPEISWVFENKAIKDDEKHKIVSDHSKEQYKMELKSASKSDQGVYKIIAKNSEGESSAEAKVNVHTEPPSFVKKIADQEVPEYYQAEFKIRANGVPKPAITWFKNGKPLKSGDDGIKIETSSEGQVSSSLFIEHFKLSNEGSYSVKAVNSAGEAECSAHLKMAQIAPGFLKPLERSVEVGEGEPLELKAKIEGSPIPQVKWFKDGEELKDDDNTKISVSPDGTIKLNIDSMKPTDSGAYKLEISNPNGKVHGTCPVIVSQSPKKPGFIKELVDTEAVEGEPLSLQAEMEGFPEPKVKWLKDGHPLRPSPNLSFIKTPSGQIGIEISSVKPEDVGQYSVTISNKLGEETSKAKVSVAEKEKKPQFLSQLMPTNVVEGFPAKLEIKVSGHPRPELTWSLNGKPIDVDGQHIKIISGPDGSECLLIDKATADDAGEYKVVAKNAQGESISKAPLSVSARTKSDAPEEKPGFVKELRDVTADEGEPITFSAPIFGNPIPDVEWSKDGQAIEPNDRVHITCNGNKVGLEINPSKLSDAGSYKCTLSNPLGEAESSAKGNVKKVFQPPQFIQRFTDIQQIPSYDAKFVARISGIPKPEVTWFKDGNAISNDDTKYKTKVDGDTYSLYVKDSEVGDAGRYKCLAANREGKATCEADLRVVEKIEKTQRAEAPSFLKKIGDCEIYPGMKAKFTACATGYPEPEVEWYRGDEKLYPSERIRMEKEDTGLLRLIIRKTNPDIDLGKYRCRIFNPHGEDSCEASIVQDSLEIRPRKPIGDQYADFDKFKSTGAPVALSDPPIISRMSDRRLTLSWKPSIPHGPREPVTYVVEMCELPDGDWFVARRGIRSCVCDIANLEPFRDYKFRIRVENKYGLSDPSPFAITHRAKLELDPPSFKPYLPAGEDFHPDYSSKFPKDYDIDRPPHDKYAQAPKFLRQEDDTQYGVKNHNCNLFWFVYGYPKPKMEYYFNDELIEMGGRYDSSYTRNGQATLFINKMLERDVGMYEAVATNEHGQARQRVRLQIAEYPQFIQRPDETTILTRKSGKLVARVVGVPYPEIKWFKDWQPLASSSRIRIAFIEPDTCILTISDAIVRDEGLYSISARNIAGAISSSVTVHIEENEAEYNYMSYSKGRDIKAKNKPLDDKYDLGDELGRGTQGITYHAVERLNGRSFAAKVMHGKGSLRPLMKNEIDIMNQLNHRKLIRLHDAFETPTSLSLVMELAGGGELLDNLTKQTFVTESEIAGYIRQILWGLEHMHDQNIAHLGLTLGDLLISHVGGDDLKICDFGLSRRLPFGKTASLEYGMPEYVSPEIVNGEGVGTAADMWALGIITHILLTGISPFKGVNDRETLTNIKETNWSFREDIWQNYSSEARDFISLLLVSHQEGRMDVKSALKHPWLNRADKMPSDEFKITTDCLRNYYNSHKDWYANASCRTWFRRQPLSGAFSHPSRMVYPPGGIFTPEATPERALKDKEPKNKTWEEQIASRDPLHYELGLIKSESHYQNGPDTYLLQLRDVDFPVRLREYMKVAANRTPSGLGFTRESLENQPHIDWRAPVIRERRRFTDVMDEEIDDERKARINKYGSPDMYTLRRLRNELGTRLDTHLEAEAMIESRREGQAPFFREKPQITAIREELPAELSCFAVGDPKPVIQWFKNDLVVAESHRIKIVEDEAGRSMIKFEPALTIDAGIYKAVARNKIGQVVARTRIVVATPPSPPDSPEVAEISDTEVLLRWKLPRDNGNSPILCYNLQYKEADDIEWTDVASNIDHEFWVVRNLRPATSHQFRLSSRNNVGWSAKGVPTEHFKTKDAGAPKISVTSAMKHYQTACESGKEIDPEELRTSHLDYSVESSPIEWSNANPTNKYSFISEITRGKFSVVVKGFNKETEEVVVGKILDCSATNKERVFQEFEALRSLRHERIASLLDAFMPSDSTGAVFIQEKLQGADILTYLASKHEYTEQMVATAVSQVLDALHYLHWRGLCHLDVQPNNIIMASVRSIEVKLVDFGSAQQVSKLGSNVQRTGALEFTAPEVLCDEPAFPQSDIWSLGVITYILLSGNSPFVGANDEETKQNINFVRYRFEHLYKELTQEATRFLMLIFKRSPSKRPSAEECFEHRWLLPTDYMMKRRERAVFLGIRLKEISEKYHSVQDGSKAWDPSSVLGKGAIARSNSIEEELTI